MPDENLKPGDEGYVEPKPLATPPDDGEGKPVEETKIKIGDKEYTTEELTKSLKDSADYAKLLPEFTKRSQALAKLLGTEPGQAPGTEEIPSFLKEGWKPKDFTELGQALKEAIEWGEKRAATKVEATVEESKEAKKIVDEFYVEVKKLDKDFDQEDFGEYVKRHGCRIENLEDLKSAYSSYSEANVDGKAIERRTLYAKNLRGKDSVSTPAPGAEKLPFDPQALRATGGRMLDLAKQALSTFKK